MLSFVLFQCEGNHYICAATPNSILLLRYNAGIGTFCTRKVRLRLVHYVHEPFVARQLTHPRREARDRLAFTGRGGLGLGREVS